MKTLWPDGLNSASGLQEAQRWVVASDKPVVLSNRMVALMVSLHGPSYLDCDTIGEVAARRGMSKRYLLELKKHIAENFGIVGVTAVSAHRKIGEGLSEPAVWHSSRQYEPEAQ